MKRRKKEGRKEKYQGRKEEKKGRNKEGVLSRIKEGTRDKDR
jgi:hypothetical protein